LNEPLRRGGAYIHRACSRREQHALPWPDVAHASHVRWPEGAYAHVDRGGGGRARALKCKHRKTRVPVTLLCERACTMVRGRVARSSADSPHAFLVPSPRVARAMIHIAHRQRVTRAVVESGTLGTRSRSDSAPNDSSSVRTSIRTPRRAERCRRTTTRATQTTRSRTNVRARVGRNDRRVASCRRFRACAAASSGCRRCDDLNPNTTFAEPSTRREREI